MFLRPTWLTALLTALALSQGLPSTSASSTGIVEVDLISPRNQTYPPSALTPIVFAVQNTEVVRALSPSITWYIEQRGVNASERIYTTGSFDLAKDVNSSSPDPFFAYAGTSRVTHEGYFAFSWQIDYSNCSTASDDDEVTLSSDSRRYNVFFTAQNGTEPADLVAATKNDTCKSSPAHAWSVSSLLEAPESEGFEGGPWCAVLADATPLPTPTPCNVKIDESAAESMQAVITERACAARDPSPELACPTPESAAAIHAPIGALFVVVGLAHYFA
ncbi:hypothetical protein BDW71DRAFT_176140 [Aspergillus fruticulosus]